MNRRKCNFFRQFTGIIVSAFIFLLLSISAFAQSTPITKSVTFNNFVASTQINDDSTLNRVRIVEVKSAKLSNSSEKALNLNTNPNSAALGFQLEKRAFDVLNQKRVENNLQPLVWSEEMARVARSHSQEMAQYKFFSHAGRNGSMVDDRADKLGYKKWRAIGENISYNRGYDNPAEFACERWMQSVSHRGNILSMRWQEAGIGVAISADGTYYFTEVFLERY